VSKREGQLVLAKAKRVGRAYGTNALNSEQFHTHILEIVDRAPLEDLSDTKKQALIVAGNSIVDLKKVIGRNMSNREILRSVDETFGGRMEFAIYSDYDGCPTDDFKHHRYGITERNVIDAWNEGLHRALDTISAVSWVANKILHLSKKRKTA